MEIDKNLEQAIIGIYGLEYIKTLQDLQKLELMERITTLVKIFTNQGMSEAWGLMKKPRIANLSDTE
jgi:hypothetical protein